LILLSLGVAVLGLFLLGCLPLPSATVVSCVSSLVLLFCLVVVCRGLRGWRRIRRVCRWFGSTRLRWCVWPCLGWWLWGGCGGRARSKL